VVSHRSWPVNLSLDAKPRFNPPPISGLKADSRPLYPHGPERGGDGRDAHRGNRQYQELRD
jgi:hypothetical protein